MDAPPLAAPPLRSWEYVEGWGMAVGAHSRVLRPRSVEELAACLRAAREAGQCLGLRGTGNSYGDASVNRQGWVLDVSRMNRILSWDRVTGVAVLEPGVTVQQLWKRILPDGWWPAVVSGTAFPTVAGALAMNIHGKNNYKVGPIGDHCVEFDLVLPSGEVVTASRERNPDLFHAAIGGFGMLGAFSRVVLRTKHVHSGEMRVKALRSRDLAEMMRQIEALKATADYLVGWLDAFPGGERAGRGLVHAAFHLQPGEDEAPERTLQVGYQELPGSILGFPKGEVWRILRLFNNDAGMRFVNAAKYLAGCAEAAQNPYLQSHAAFAFLLDYVPNYKFAFGTERGRRGLIQFQSFVPHAAAHDVYLELLQRSRDARLVPYLAVLKRHRPDPFWMTHSVDGWSLALDYKVTPGNRAALWTLCDALTEVVIAAGGRFYFAKDLVIGPDDARRCFPPENLARFLELKQRLDPGLLLQTDLFRRVFGALMPPRQAAAAS